MKLASHGTGGARRRMRYHSREHRALTFRGRAGDGLVFECHGTDGRTYTLRLSLDDVEAVAEAIQALRAAAVQKGRRDRGEGEGRGGHGQIPLLGAASQAGPVPDELAADGFKAV